MDEQQQKQIDRVTFAGLLVIEDVDAYLKKPDIIEVKEGDELPAGFKRCGKCKQVMKFYLFNINNGTKTKCTGNCKQCQKDCAQKSYSKNRKKRDYKEYYQANKERKQEHGRSYYEKNKEKILAKQQEYHKTKEGKKVMRKSHAKRRDLLARNKGIVYKRDWVIDRDKMGQEFPICYICELPIKHTREIQLDHVVPVVLGGGDCFTNIACTHQLCNLRKEKDARKLSVEQVENIIERAEKYIDEHPELFTEQ